MFEDRVRDAAPHKFHELLNTSEGFVEDEEVAFLETADDNIEDIRVIFVVSEGEDSGLFGDEFLQIDCELIQLRFLLRWLQEVGNLKELLWEDSREIDFDAFRYHLLVDAFAIETFWDCGEAIFVHCMSSFLLGLLADLLDFFQVH